MSGGYNEDKKDRVGNSPEAIAKLVAVAKEHRVNYIIVEKNNDNSYKELLKGDLAELKIEPWHQKLNKEERIINTIQHLLAEHRLIIDEQVFREDFQSEPTHDLNYKLFYQFLTMPVKDSSTTSQGFRAPNHDDRIDAMVTAIQYLVKRRTESYCRAAQEGNIEACYKLGGIYQKGLGGKQNYKEAKRYYEKAAKKNHVDAQNRLREMYKYGWGVNRVNKAPKKAKKWSRKVAKTRATLADINTKAEYDENMILMVWDFYIRSQGRVKYFVDNGNYLKTFFKDDGNRMGLTPCNPAGLLVKRRNKKRKINELYLNDSNKSISICGPVDYKPNLAENTVITNLEVAIDQIKLWNTQQVATSQRIVEHLVIFPYHITSGHWALGILELKINENNQLERAEVKIFNPLPDHGGRKVSNIARDNIQTLLSEKFNNTDIKLIAESSEHNKQQNDGASCGAISAENGKFFLGGGLVEDIPLNQTYPWGAEQLRRKHIEEVGRKDFEQAQFNKPAQDPEFYKPSNYQELKRNFTQSIETLEHNAKETILNIIRKIKKVEEINTAIEIKDFIKEYQDNFRSILILFIIDEENWKFNGDHINTLVNIIKDYYQDLLKGSKQKSNDRGPFNQLKETAEKEDENIVYKKVINHPPATLKKLALQGNKSAQERLIETAEKGDKGAQHTLGQIYEKGIGIEQNKEKAIEWYIKAANQEYQPSFNMLKRRMRSGVHQNNLANAWKIYKNF